MKITKFISYILIFSLTISAFPVNIQKVFASEKDQNNQETNTDSENRQIESKSENEVFVEEFEKDIQKKQENTEHLEVKESLASTNNLIANTQSDDTFLPVEKIDGLFAFNSSTPQEAGALSNNGNVNVSEFTGAASYNYNISLPAGRNGLTPSISLGYSSQNTSNNNIAGYGWTFPVSQIQRNTGLGITEMYKNENSFIVHINGSSTKFIYIKDTPQGKLYQPKYQMSSLRLYKKSEGFELFDGSGTQYIFGFNDYNRDQKKFPDTPEKNKIFSWKLERIIDTNGNEILYEYFMASGHPNTTPHTLQLDRIQYNQHQNAYLTQIQFFYDDRKDITDSAHAGFTIHNNRRLSKIEVFHENQKRREIELSYTLGNNGKRSLLTAIQETGYDKNGNATPAPKATFNYSSGNEITYEETPELANEKAYPYANSYYINGTNKYFEENKIYKRDPYDTEYQEDISIFDYNGDGINDIITGEVGRRTEHNLSPVAIHDGENGWTNMQDSIKFETGRLFVEKDLLESNLNPIDYVKYPYPRELESNGKIFMDINGDKHFDILQYNRNQQYVSRNINKILLNNGDNTFSESPYKLPVPTRVLFTTTGTKKIREKQIDYGVRFGDINGDGLPDIVHAFDGYTHYSKNNGNDIEEQHQTVYLNTGNGFERNDTFLFPGDFAFSKHFYSNGKFFTRNSGQLFDINSDGLADLFLESTFYINTGNGWKVDNTQDWKLPFSATKTLYQGGFHFYVDSGLRFSDINADGLLDAIQSQQNENNNQTTQVALNTGNGFELQTLNNFPLPFIHYKEETIEYPGKSGKDTEITAKGNGVILEDINNDGVTDIIFSKLRVELGQRNFLSQKNSQPKKLLASLSPLLIGTTINFENAENFIASSYPGYYNSSYAEDPAATLTQHILLAKNKVPDRLVTVDNGQGGTIDFDYQLSSKYKENNENANKNLPLNMWTVKSITVNDNVSQTSQTTEYHYANGKYRTDIPDERSFVGFGKVEKTHQNGKKTLTHYHLDPVRSGTPFHTEVRDTNDNILSQSKSQSRIETLNNRELHIPETSISLSRFGGEEKATASNALYDIHTGNVLEQIHLGEVRIDSVPENVENFYTYTDIENDTIKNVYTYTTNEEKNIHSAVATSARYDSANTLLAKKRVRYDNLSEGEIIKGNITQSDTWFEDELRYITTSFAYNAFGQPTQKTDALGSKTTITYDTFNLSPQKITNALNQSIQFTYDTALGVTTSITDLNGFTHSSNYDGLGRVLNVSVPKSESDNTQVTLVSYTYNTTNIPNSTTTKAKAIGTNETITTKAYFDGLLRPIQTRSETNVQGKNTVLVTENMYNNFGQNIFTSQPYTSNSLNFTTPQKDKLGTHTTYDILDRPVRIETPVGSSTISYKGWKTTTINANNQKSITEVDAFGRNKYVTQYRGNTPLTTSFIYSIDGTLNQIIDAEGNKRDFSYDSLKRKVSASQWYRNGNTPQNFWNYAFNDLGLITKITDPRGEKITYTYDKLHRPLTEKASDYTTTSIYDTAKNGVGKLSNTTGENNTTQLAYDHLGRIIKTVETIENKTYTTKNTFDITGLPTQIQYPNGDQVNYVYNTKNQLVSVDYTEANGNTKNIVNSIEYSPVSHITKTVYSNGNVTKNTYDPEQAFRMVEKKTVNGENTLQNFGYTYDNLGNITSITDTANNETVQYTYDDLNQLISANVIPSAVIPASCPSEHCEDRKAGISRTYQYDNIGNILYKSDVGTYEYNEANPQQLSKIIVENTDSPTEIAYTYDASGNITSKGDFTYTWDSRGRMRTANSEDVNGNFLYNPSGKRIVKNVNNKKKTYVGEIFETSGPFKETMYVFAGNQRIATLNNFLQESETTTEVTTPVEDEVQIFTGNIETNNLIASETLSLLASENGEEEISEDYATGENRASLYGSSTITKFHTSIIDEDTLGKLATTTIPYNSEICPHTNSECNSQKYSLTSQKRKYGSEFIISLSRPQKINEISTHINKDNYSAKYKIEVSNDNKTFLEVANTQNFTNGKTTHHFPTMNVKFIKITGILARGSNMYETYRLHINEVEARFNPAINLEHEPGIDVAQPILGAEVLSPHSSKMYLLDNDLTQNRVALTTMNFNYDTCLENFTVTACNNTKTYGPNRSNKYGTNFTVNLGQLQAINEVTFIGPNNYKYAYNIETSTDGENFTQVASQEEKVSGSNTLNFETTETQFIRIVFTNTTDANYIIRGIELDVKLTPELIVESDSTEATPDEVEPEVEQPQLTFGDFENRTLAYHHPDHLGSASVSTNENGEIVEDVQYFPFGDERSRNGSFEGSFGYTDQERDTDIGLMYYDARYYDPVVGRFMSRDAWEGNLMVPLTLNKYSYVLNNPLIYNDPTGLYPVLSEVTGLSEIKNLLSKAKNEITEQRNQSDEIINLSQPSAKEMSSIMTDIYKGTIFSQFISQKTNIRTNARYIYVEEGGWIDLKHFFSIADRAYNHGYDSAISYGEWVENEQSGNTFGLENIIGGLKSFVSSAYSFEDLTSNTLGAYFGAYYLPTKEAEGILYSEALESFFTEMGIYHADEASAFHETITINGENWTLPETYTAEDNHPKLKKSQITKESIENKLNN